MSSRRYARGPRAWGHCERSGKKLLLRDMVEDGHQKGLQVAPDWYEPRHPQEYIPRVEEAVALRFPSPARNRVPYTVRFPMLDEQLQKIVIPQVKTDIGLYRARSDQPVTGEEVTTEQNDAVANSTSVPDGQELVATADDIATFRVTLNDPGILDQESTTELGAEATSGTVGEDGNEATSETGTVNVVVVEAGFGSGAFGEGTWSN